MPILKTSKRAKLADKKVQPGSHDPGRLRSPHSRHRGLHWARPGGRNPAGVGEPRRCATGGGRRCWAPATGPSSTAWWTTSCAIRLESPGWVSPGRSPAHLGELKKFNYERIYLNPKIKTQHHKIRTHGASAIFDHYLSQLRNGKTTAPARYFPRVLGSDGARVPGGVLTAGEWCATILPA